MKKLINTNDNEVVFYEDEVNEARTYYNIKETCESLENVAMYYNDEHSNEGIGELKVRS